MTGQPAPIDCFHLYVCVCVYSQGDPGRSDSGNHSLLHVIGERPALRRCQQGALQVFQTGLSLIYTHPAQTLCSEWMFRWFLCSSALRCSWQIIWGSSLRSSLQTTLPWCYTIPPSVSLALKHLSFIDIIQYLIENLSGQMSIHTSPGSFQYLIPLPVMAKISRLDVYMLHVCITTVTT